MMMSQSSLLVLVVMGAVVSAQMCKDDIDCHLNGVCTSGACVCDKPWKAPNCGELAYKITPASGKNLYATTDPRNTWNGPIVTGTDGKFHLFDPIYKVGSLGGPTAIMHGVADNVTGPYDWKSQPNLPTFGGENPAFVVFPNATTKKMVYSLWVPSAIQVADSPYGPFRVLEGVKNVGGNPAPIYYKGAFYKTNQKTSQVDTTTDLTQEWTKYSDISHAQTPADWMIEDPFMWVDKRDNWHIINHAYNNHEFENCGSSLASAHFYSIDGKTWNTSSVEPYSHTVQYDDGTSHTYTTLERPNLHFDVNGQLTHINLAADLVTGNEGCGNRTRHAHNGHTPCDNCKWDDHAGTTIIALDV